MAPCPILRGAYKKQTEAVDAVFDSVVPYSDNFFAALNAAVFSDGSFC
jgi:Fe-S cluster assembly protein SufB